MRPSQPQPVFPQDLAQRVLRFCDAPEHQEAYAKQTALIGHDPASFRPWLAQTPIFGQNNLNPLKDKALRVENPTLLRASLNQSSQISLAASPELALARKALYDATRFVMRAAPNEKLSQDLFEAACEAWLAQVTASPDIRTYAANHEVLNDTRTIWAGKKAHGRVNLMGRAQLPPFFDGNTHLVALFIQSPHAACDMTALARLPQLACVSLYTDPHGPMVETIRRIVPHLSTITSEDDVIVHLCAPGHAVPHDWGQAGSEP